MIVKSRPRVSPVAGALLGLGVLLGGAGAASATTVDGLYQAEVEVSGQDEEERDKAFGLALWEVLVKVTGDSSVPSRPELQVLFQRARRLVQKFRYELIEQGQDARVSDDEFSIDNTAQPSGPSHRLWVQFEQSTIDRQLGQLGVPVWGRERPETLVWLAVQDGAYRYLLASGGNGPVRDELLRVAAQRGMPLLLPVLDFNDRARVRFADIRGNFASPVLAASARYAVNSVLAGNLVRGAGGRWTAQWTLYRGAAPSSWRADSPDLQAALLSGVEGAAGLLSRELAIGGYGTGLERLTLAVEDVGAMTDYARLVAYLQGLSLVQQVMIERVARRQVTLALTVQGSVTDLRRTIALGDVLVPVTGARATDAAFSSRGVDLVYAYLP